MRPQHPLVRRAVKHRCHSRIQTIAIHLLRRGQVLPPASLSWGGSWFGCLGCFPLTGLSRAVKHRCHSRIQTIAIHLLRRGQVLPPAFLLRGGFGLRCRRSNTRRGLGLRCRNRCYGDWRGRSGRFFRPSQRRAACRAAGARPLFPHACGRHRLQRALFFPHCRQRGEPPRAEKVDAADSRHRSPSRRRRRAAAPLPGVE